jgi:hypothetical protein
MNTIRPACALGTTVGVKNNWNKVYKEKTFYAQCTFFDPKNILTPILYTIQLQGYYYGSYGFGREFHYL